MFRILSIDGGGIRGVIPGILLQHLEAETGKRIADMFDLIVGTSTGGILAAGLTVPDTKKKPKFTAEAMVRLYTDHGAEIFDRSLWKKLTSGYGALDELYPHKNLEKLLKARLGNATLKDCLTPIVLTSYDIEARAPYFFKTRRARKSERRNHYLRDAARATSAAPTYFEPAEVMTVNKPKVRRALVDGGVFVNNPSVCAFTEAMTMNAKPDDILLVSLGTGVATRKIPYDDAKDWGALGWIRPVISVMMDGVADAADYQMRQMLPDEKKGAAQRYFRFDTELDLASDDLDETRAGNIKNLKDEASQIISDQDAELRRLIGVLS